MQHPRISSHLHPDNRPRLGVFIDAESVSGIHAERLMQSVNELGRVTVCRAYGDWTTDFLIGWKKWLHPLGIGAVQRFHYTQGKSASGTTLIMDVMEQLPTDLLDAVCIASCDSDFVGLVSRVQEHGPMVYGYGQYGTSPAFIAACDGFVFLDGSSVALGASSPELLVRQGFDPAPR